MCSPALLEADEKVAIDEILQDFLKTVREDKKERQENLHKLQLLEQQATDIERIAKEALRLGNNIRTTSFRVSKSAEEAPRVSTSKSESAALAALQKRWNETVPSLEREKEELKKQLEEERKRFLKEKEDLKLQLVERVERFECTQQQNGRGTSVIKHREMSILQQGLSSSDESSSPKQKMEDLILQNQHLKITLSEKEKELESLHERCERWDEEKQKYLRNMAQMERELRFSQSSAEESKKKLEEEMATLQKKVKKLKKAKKDLESDFRELKQTKDSLNAPSNKEQVKTVSKHASLKMEPSSKLAKSKTVVSDVKKTRSADAQKQRRRSTLPSSSSSNPTSNNVQNGPHSRLNAHDMELINKVLNAQNFTTTDEDEDEPPSYEQVRRMSTDASSSTPSTPVWRDEAVQALKRASVKKK